jgi:hypothetical protein
MWPTLAATHRFVILFIPSVISNRVVVDSLHAIEW